MFRLIWNAIMVMLITINIFYIPMKLSFDFKYESYDVSECFLKTLPACVFVIDLLLNFNTAYYHKGVIYNARKMITNHYLKGNFKLDLLMISPIILSGFQIQYIDIISLLRAIRLKIMVEHLEEVLNLKFKIQAVFDLFKSVLFIIFVCHTVACAWHYIGII